MITLILEENNLLKDSEVIIDVSSFFRDLPLNVEVTLVIKSHDIAYHYCPVKKAARFMKAAEFSQHHWIGEKSLAHHSMLKSFYSPQLLIAGILPSSFMQQVIQIIARENLSLKGVYLWSDSLMQTYQPISSGWVMILHEQQLFICHNQVLKFSRYCSRSLAEELPRVFRYIKRFGYETNSPITLLANEFISEDLPSYVKPEIRTTSNWKPQGIKINIPELQTQERNHSWPQKIQRVSKSLTALMILCSLYTAIETASLLRQEHKLQEQIASLSIEKPLSSTKIDAFLQYCHLIRGRENPLILIRQFSPLLREDAVVTYLHWTSGQLILQMELNPEASVDQLWLTLRSQFLEYQISWQADESESLKGVLTIEKNKAQKVT
jgi:hypothetical protein